MLKGWPASGLACFISAGAASVSVLLLLSVPRQGRGFSAGQYGALFARPIPRRGNILVFLSIIADKKQG